MVHFSNAETKELSTINSIFVKLSFSNEEEIRTFR